MKKKLISILTATRAEYGILKPLIKKLYNLEQFDTRIVVTGMHLSVDFGLTYQEIEQDGFDIDEKIDILDKSDTAIGISRTMGQAIIKFAEYFDKIRPDILIVLGDRYETLAICCAAVNARIPIAHLYGGETTEGALDECYRHAITKMSYLHFTSTKRYRDRVIQLGENPERVFHVGSLGIENIRNTKLLTLNELEHSINKQFNSPFAIVTFHPVTLDDNSECTQLHELLKALETRNDLFYIITKSNADIGGREINNILDQFATKHENVLVVDSLGMLKYLSALKYCKFVIGNSSSGLIEAPSFGIPTINIGDRQKGRIQCDSIINCKPCYSEILQCISLALSNGFILKAKNVNNPYEYSNTSDKIVTCICDFLLQDKLNLKKSFYNIEMD